MQQRVNQWTALPLFYLTILLYSLADCRSPILTDLTSAQRNKRAMKMLFTDIELFLKPAEWKGPAGLLRVHQGLPRVTRLSSSLGGDPLLCSCTCRNPTMGQVVKCNCLIIVSLSVFTFHMLKDLFLHQHQHGMIPLLILTLSAQFSQARMDRKELTAAYGASAQSATADCAASRPEQD